MATLIRCARILAKNSLQTCKRTPITLLPRCQIYRKFSRVATLYSDKRYSKEHEWVTVEGNVCTLGISDYAQESLGDIVFAQLPDPGEEFDAGDEVGALESVKAASELYTPVSGTIKSKNTAVEENPGIINKSPYEDGWLYKMEMTKPYEVDALMDEDAYNSFLEEQEDE